MKITARIRFEKPANREFVIRSFFSEAEFSRSNTIMIDGDKTAEVEIVFTNTPPQSIIKAISNCIIESMEFCDDGNAEQKVSQKETDNEDSYNISIVEENPIDKPDVIAEVEGDVFGESIKKKRSYKKRSIDDRNTEEAIKPKNGLRRGRHKASEDDYLNIPYIEELATKCADFDVFVIEISAWLGLDKVLDEFFCALMKELRKLEQKPYELRLLQVEEATRHTDSRPCRLPQLSKYMTEFLREKGICGSLMPFLITVLKYKDSFDHVEETVENIAETVETSNADSVEDTKHEELEASGSIVNEEQNSDGVKQIIPPPLASFSQGYPKMKEQPEETETEKTVDNLKSNPNVAEILDKIDKSLPVREQITFLYSEMGFNKPSKSIFDKLCKITETALTMETLDSIDAVMLNAGYSTDSPEGLKVKCKISDLVNDYNKANHIKRMKVVAFLREIKSIFSLE